MNIFSSSLHYCTLFCNLIYFVVWRVTSFLVGCCTLSAALFWINSSLIWNKLFPTVQFHRVGSFTLSLLSLEKTWNINQFGKVYLIWLQGWKNTETRSMDFSIRNPSRPLFNKFYKWNFLQISYAFLPYFTQVYFTGPFW